MFILLMLQGALAAEPADRDHSRWTRRVERCEGRLVQVEGRWVEVCEVDDAPRRDHVLNRLIGTRARHERAQARLRALGRPSTTREVFFATNRAARDAGYGESDGGAIVYGVATVHIPADHPQGEMEADLAILSLQTMDVAAWQSRLSDAAGDDVGLFTYVHGYNNSFDYAVRRGAQLGYDLDLPLIPVVFSWPSAGETWFSTAKYTFDENAAARSAGPFSDFLGSLLEEQSSPVVLMAHSMGSRVVVEGMLDLERAGRLIRPVDELVLAAPDIDATVFARRYLDIAVGHAGRVTLYCADDDRALKLSRQVHGGYDRLGSCREESLRLVEGPHVEVVDASRLYVDLIDHDKVASSPRLIDDLRHVLVGATIDAEERGLDLDGPRYRLPP